ncbi:MAG: ECF transporter S component [Acholeplasmataceae bacterium]
MEKNWRIKEMLYIVTFAALAVVLSLFEIPLGLPWLKIDLSEIVVLVAFISIGFNKTLLIILIRGLLRQFIQGDILVPTELWGEVIAMIASITLMASFYVISKIYNREEKPLFRRKECNVTKISPSEFIITVIGVTVVLSLVMIILNIFITTPIYLSLYAYFLEIIPLEGFHFTVFTLLDDPGMTNVFGVDLSNWKLYLTYIIANYALLNVSKGIITSIIFIPIRESLYHMNLNYLN